MASVVPDQMSIVLCEGDEGQAGTLVWVLPGNVDEPCTRGARLGRPPPTYDWCSREC